MIILCLSKIRDVILRTQQKSIIITLSGSKDKYRLLPGILLDAVVGPKKGDRNAQSKSLRGSFQYETNRDMSSSHCTWPLPEPWPLPGMGCGISPSIFVDLVVLASDSNSIKRKYVTTIPIANNKIQPIKTFCFERREIDRKPSRAIFHSSAYTISEKNGRSWAMVHAASCCNAATRSRRQDKIRRWVGRPTSTRTYISGV